MVQIIEVSKEEAKVRAANLAKWQKARGIKTAAEVKVEESRGKAKG